VATEPEPTKPGEERDFEVAPKVKMRFCWVPPGKAALGSPTTEKGRELFGLSEKEHEFTTKGFWLGKFEVMQGEWTSTMGSNPSAFAATGSQAEYREKVKGMDTSRFPVEQVSWENCQKFIDKSNAHMNKKTGRFALPREDEWEYACRGGKGNGRAFYWVMT
jgi:formylglycine-generating enzyme required for sulfatase activity